LRPWTGKASSSKSTGSSLAFARGLHRWRAVATHDSLASYTVAAESTSGWLARSTLVVAIAENEKP
jgi:hypothetical protein